MDSTTINHDILDLKYDLGLMTGTYGIHYDDVCLSAHLVYWD